MTTNIEATICTDCALWHANGDLSGLDNLPEAEAAERREAIIGADTDGYVVVVDDGEASFSWRSCDLCRTPLGGDRLDATFIPINTPVDKEATQ